jgi:hypothetical protein
MINRFRNMTINGHWARYGCNISEFHDDCHMNADLRSSPHANEA